MDSNKELLESRMAGIEGILIDILARLNQIEGQDHDIIGDIDDCAKWIKRSSSTIYKLTSKKRIPFLKNGKRLLFNKSEVLEWLKKDRQSTIGDIQWEIDQNLQRLAPKL